MSEKKRIENSNQEGFFLEEAPNTSNDLDLASKRTERTDFNPVQREISSCEAILMNNREAGDFATVLWGSGEVFKRQTVR